jgi:hypothetical protein
MANKDLYHSDGNATKSETLSKMRPSSNLGSDKYASQNRGKKNNTKVTEKGWSK